MYISTNVRSTKDTDRRNHVYCESNSIDRLRLEDFSFQYILNIVRFIYTMNGIPQSSRQFLNSILYVVCECMFSGNEINKDWDICVKGKKNFFFNEILNVLDRRNYKKNDRDAGRKSGLVFPNSPRCIVFMHTIF